MTNSMEQQELDFAQPNAGLRIIEREEAQKKGLKRYFTGKPCLRGHISERTVSTYNCIECDQIRSRKKHEKLKKIVNSNKDVIHNKNKFIYCNKCNKSKEATTINFHKSKLDRGGKSEICKECRKEHVKEYSSQEHVKKANKERVRRWCEENKDRKNKNSREWKANNKDKVYEYNVKYMEKKESKKLRRIASKKRYWDRPEKYRAISSAYDRRVRMSKPEWQCMKEVKAFYQIAKLFNLEVDHIVPINSDIVCGLHCLDNFQLLTREENASKGNRFWPDMP